MSDPAEPNQSANHPTLAALSLAPLPSADATVTTRLAEPAAGNAAPIAASPGVAAPFPRLGVVLIAFCLILSFAKLWMVRNDEIVAFQSSYDAEWYLKAADGWYWNQTYYPSAIIRRPMYPMFIGVSNLIGLPLRQSIEIFFLASAFVLVAAMVRAGLGRVFAGLAFAGVVLNPWSFSVHRMVVSEPFYASILMLMLAAMIRLLAARAGDRRWLLAGLIGLLLAVLWETRKESELVIAGLIAFAMLAAFAIPLQPGRWQKIGRGAVFTFVIPLVLVVAVVLAVRSATFARYGLFADDLVSSTAFSDANRAMLRIKPENPKRYYPVPADAREKAFAASPTFARLRPHYDRFMKRVKGDIPAFWLFWDLHEAVYATNPQQSAVDSDATFRKIADELNAAADAGRLPTRPVYSDFLDPEFSVWIGQTPASFAQLAQLFVVTTEPPYLSDAMFRPPPETQELFDRVALRRPVSVPGPVVTITGWAFAPGDKLDRIEIFAADRVLADTAEFTSRPDVVKAFGEQVGSDQCGFALNLPFDIPPGYKGTIVFITASEKKVHVPCQMMPDGKVQTGKPVGKGVTFNVESARTIPPQYTPLEVKIRRWIWRNYGRMAIGVTCLAGASLVVALVQLVRGRLTLRDPAVLVVVLLMFVILTRMAVFTILDAAAWRCDTEPRFIFPVMILFPATMLLVIFATARSLRRRRSLQST